MLERIFGTTGIEKIVSREIELTTQKRAAVAALAVAREFAGAALVEGEAKLQLGAVTRLVEEISAQSRALDLVRARRTATIVAENAAAASRLRSQAKEKHGELAALNAKVAKLLSDIGKLEGVHYGRQTCSMAANGQERSDALAVEIRDLTEKAEALESGAVAKNGHYHGDDVLADSEVIAGVLRHHSEVPTAAAIGDWLSACADNVRVPGRNFGALSRTVRLTWAGGVIDTAASYVFVPGLTRKATGRPMSDGSINSGESEFADLASGEFRAAA